MGEVAEGMLDCKGSAWRNELCSTECVRGIISPRSWSEMENLSPQTCKIRIYLLTRASVRSSEFQGWEEESRPVESEMTPSHVWRARAEHLPVGSSDSPCGGVSVLGEAAA